MPGILYIVSTPIGNLEDITLRALRVLREVQVIACEDTRQTGKLLQHFGIAVPTVSYHDHNEVERTAELLERLTGDQNVALVSVQKLCRQIIGLPQHTTAVDSRCGYVDSRRHTVVSSHPFKIVTSGEIGLSAGAEGATAPETLRQTDRVTC